MFVWVVWGLLIVGFCCGLVGVWVFVVVGLGFEDWFVVGLIGFRVCFGFWEWVWSYLVWECLVGFGCMGFVFCCLFEFGDYVVL